MRTALVLIVFTAVFTSLTVSSYRQESATTDEPHYLSAGYADLKLGDHRLDLDHLPFLQIWAALPLMTIADVRLNTNTVSWSSAKLTSFCHEFLYVDNDADRLLYRARLMTVLLGLLLGSLLFCWGHELFGFWPATILLALFCFEPNILAHSRLATTDVGITCFIFGAVYFLWRTTRKLSAANLTGLFAFFSLAQVSKFSALILIPIALTLLAVHAYRSQRWRLVLGIVAALAVVSYGAIWATYGFRYAPAPAESGVERIVSGPRIHKEIPTLAAAIDWVDDHKLLPNAYLQAFAVNQGWGQHRHAYFFGEFRFAGWWYYFPVAFLIKTPLSLIVLFVAGLAVYAMDRSRSWQDDIFILLPMAIYFGVAMTMDVNVGVRHILPIYPFALLVAGKAVMKVSAKRSKPVVFAVAALILLQIGDVMAVHPHYLAFFNQFVGGPKNGYKYLADSNIDWGQDLKNLKKWMDDNGVDRINLAYFGSADPAYYGINCIFLRGSPIYEEDKIRDPALPGLVAVSINNLTGANLDGDPFYRPLLNTKPVAEVGYSIRVYRVNRPWQ